MNKNYFKSHAGYSYCGKTAAYAYKYLSQLKETKNELKVFLLGPSHYFYSSKIVLSSLSEYDTPLGKIPLDQEIIENLSKTNDFDFLDKEKEENEHSLEMQLPYIFKTMSENIKLIPLMVGNVDIKQQEKYAETLVKYFDQENCIFVISSDFCHWGSRFKYQYYLKEDGEIFESIRKLDRKGMDIIEKHDYNSFLQYLNETKNTICGRTPISLLLKVFSVFLKNN